MISKWQMKYFGRPFAVCEEKDLKPLIEGSNDATLKDQDAIFNPWREYFSNLLNPVDVTSTHIHEE